MVEAHEKVSSQNISTHLFELAGPFHDSGKGLCVTQLFGLRDARLNVRPSPDLPHVFAT